MITVTCDSDSTLMMPSMCSLNGTGGIIDFSCEWVLGWPCCVIDCPFFLAGNASEVILSGVDYPPGEYDLTIRLQDSNGQSAEILFEFVQLPGVNKVS